VIKVTHIVDARTIGGVNSVIKAFDVFFKYDELISNITLIHHCGSVDLKNFESISKKIELTESNWLTLLRAIRKIFIKSDLLILHGFTPAIAFATLFTKSKIIFINHGILGTGRKLKKYEIIKKYLFKKYLKFYVDKIVNVSIFAENKIISTYRINKIKSSVIYDSTNFKKQKYERRISEKLLLGFHGRFVWFKRIDRLILASSILNKSIKTAVHLIGDGPLKEDYITLANSLNVELKIEDYCQDIPDKIRNFNYEVIPSDEENFGVSVIESIICGNITFVLKDGGGCTEIFGEDYKWYICDDEYDLSEKILKLEKHFDKIDYNRFASLQVYVETNFNGDIFRKSYKDLFIDLYNKN
jgi:glycosyltransferase involved in cell wall biosynthesis